LLASDSLVGMLPLWRTALDNLERALLRHLAAAHVASLGPAGSLR
jgi:hypothetical protein